MFDGICILLALFLYYKVEEGYRDIAFFVLCFFVVSNVVYRYFFLEFRAIEGNRWFIYQLYNCVNVAVIWKLWRLKEAIFVRRVLLVNVLLNIAVSYYFISNMVHKLIYTIYPYPAAILMLLCLFYLWMVGYGIRMGNNKVNHTGFICTLLRYCVYSGSGDRLGVRVQTSRVER